MKKNKLLFGILTIIAFAALLAFSLGVRAWHIQKSPLPFSFDPFHHMAKSAQIVAEGKIDATAGYDIVGKRAYYPPLLPIIGAYAQRVGIDLIFFYRYFALVIALAIGILMYLFLRRLFPPWPSIIGSIGYLSIPYVMHRTILTLPENLSLVFIIAILWLLALFNESKNGWTRVALFAGIAFMAYCGYYTHVTYVLGIAIVLIDVFLILLAEKKWAQATVFTTAAIIVGLWLRKKIPTHLAFNWPSLGSIHRNFGYPPFIVSIIGLFAAIIDNIKSKKQIILVSVIVPLVGGWFLYQGRGEGLTRLEPERWLIFVSIALAIGFAGAAQLIYKYIKITWLKVALFIVLAIVLFWPRWAAPWPQIYNGPEYEAAIYIRDNLPEDSLYFSQPILEWLLRGVSHRSVIWGAGQPEDNLGQVDFSYLVELAKKYKASSAYIVFSDNPNNPQNDTLMSDGTTAPLDLAGILETPEIDKTKFACLPIAWDNGTVTIYELPLDGTLAKACTRTNK